MITRPKARSLPAPSTMTKSSSPAAAPYTGAAAKYRRFEWYPAWPPSLDGQSDFARMLYVVNGFYGFE